VDFAAASAALGAWARRVETMGELRMAVKDAMQQRGPAVIEAIIDPAEYRAHAGLTAKLERNPSFSRFDKSLKLPGLGP